MLSCRRLGGSRIRLPAASMSRGDFTTRRCRYIPDRFVNAGRSRLRCSPAGATSEPTAADLLQLQPERPVACPAHKKASAWPAPESGCPAASMSRGDFTARRCRYIPDRFVNAGRSRLRCSPAGATSEPTAADLLQLQPGQPVACPAHKKASAWPAPESGCPAASMSRRDFMARRCQCFPDRPVNGGRFLLEYHSNMSILLGFKGIVKIRLNR